MTTPVAACAVASSSISVSTSGAPGSYSSFISGNHAVGTTNYISSVNSQFPIRNSAITAGLVTTSVVGTVISTGAWDFAYDIWFSATPNPTGNLGNTAGSGLEMMIWLNELGSIQPSGTSKGTVTLGGVVYTAWYATGTVGPISYVANTKVTSVTNLDLLPFINDAISRGFMTGAWYLVDVECGFEIWTGGAGLTITSFSCTNGVAAVTGGGTGGSSSLTQTFDEGVNGAAITVANSTGSGSNAFDVISSSGGTAIFSNAASAHGTVSGAFSTSATGGVASVSWSTSMGTQTTIYGRTYLNLSAYPTNNDAVIEFVNSGVFSGGIQISNSGQIMTQDAAYVNLTAAISSQLIPLNTWIRLEWKLVCGAAGAASLNINYYSVKDSTVISETMTDASGPYGSGATPAVNAIMFGWNNSHPSQPVMYLDEISINATSYPGPTGSVSFLSQDFESGTSGTTLTIANTTGAGESAFDVVSTTNAAVAAFSNVNSIDGTLSGVFSTGTTAGVAYAGWTSSFGSPVTTFYGRVYLYLTAYPASQDSNIQIRGTSASNAGNITINTAGHLYLQNPAFTYTNLFTNAIPLNTWVRVEWKMITGAAGSASFTVNYYASPESTTPTETQVDSTSAWGGTGGVAEVNFGWTNAHISQPSIYMDNILVNSYQYPGPVGGTPPTTVTNAALSVGATSATLYGTTNPNGISTTAQFEYGLTTGYGTIVPSPAAICGAGIVPVAVTSVLLGLASNTTYHYRLDAQSSAGTAFGSDVTFTTGASSPVVNANATVSITNVSAILNGTVNPEGASTVYQFYYGPTNSYGSTSPASPGSAGSGSSPVNVSTAITGLTPNTIYHYQIAAQNATGSVTSPDATFTTSAVSVPTFPSAPLGILVQILINGSWVDISDAVYQRDDIVISGRGRPDETTQTSPATLTLTLNNRGGAFSPNNATSPFYPYIQNNTQIRISVNSKSSSGVIYSGYRFWGEVRKWPPSWDVTGNDVHVPVSAGGLLTRYIQGGNIQSALHRFYDRKTDATAPVAHWTCEELVGATQFANHANNFTSLSMTWSGTPNLSADSSCNGCDPIPQIMGSVWSGNTGSYSFNGPLFFTIPGVHYFVAPGTVTSLSSVTTQGGSGGGANGGNGCGGGGGGWEAGYAIGVTPGKLYAVVVGKGGNGASGSNTGFLPGGDGSQSSFAGDTATVIAYGGRGGNSAGPGQGGSGASGFTHYSGGNGGTGGSGGGGGGGGGVGGQSGNGGNGYNGTAGSGSLGGYGGAAGPGGGSGNGGKGGNSQIFENFAFNASLPGNAPGGGGGAGAWNVGGTSRGAGAPGAPGAVSLNYTSTSIPNDTVIRFVVDIPATGMPDRIAIVRANISGGTMAGGYIEAYYGNVGKLGIRGYTASSVNVFDSFLFAFGAARSGPLMVSMELQTSGSYVNWTLGVVRPGSGVWSGPSGSFIGTIGSVNSVIVNPTGKIQDTAVGSIIVQYALESLTDVSPALGGYNGEMAVDRFYRLCTEEGVKGLVVGDASWNFNDGTTQGWSGTNGASVSSTATDSSNGMFSLLATVASFSPSATFYSPSTLPCIAGQTVSAYVDVQPIPGPNNLTGQIINFNLIFYNSSGGQISSVVNSSVLTLTLAGSFTTQSVTGKTAPFGTAYVGVSVVESSSYGVVSQFLIDGVSIAIGSQMGPQKDDTFVNLLQECEDVDRGLMTEARDFYGLRYRNRASMQNQSPALTMNYTAAQISAGFQPVFDESRIRNNVIVSRPNGSTWDASVKTGNLSIQLPPNGVGVYRYNLACNCYLDKQLASIGAWILSVGTVNEYRYPSLPIDLSRSESATIFHDAAQMDSGDYLRIINAPTDRLPASTINQLATGFEENINTFKWTITLSCVPENAYTGSGLATW